MRLRNRAGADEVRQCSHCAATDTSNWRRHPLTREYLCNACGALAACLVAVSMDASHWGGCTSSICMWVPRGELALHCVHVLARLLLLKCLCAHPAYLLPHLLVAGNYLKLHGAMRPLDGSAPSRSTAPGGGGDGGTPSMQS